MGGLLPLEASDANNVSSQHHVRVSKLTQFSIHLKSFIDMNLEDSEKRLIILECLRENSTNMRIEHQGIRDRISAAIDQARLNLLHIRRLNEELKEMKVTVENTLVLSMNEQDRILDAIEDRLGTNENEGQLQGVSEPKSVKIGIEVDTMTDDDITQFSQYEQEFFNN